jgi:uncharacterized RDD family membrane protein YckC
MDHNLCPACGSELPYEEAEICPKCGVRIKDSPQPLPEYVSSTGYAGFRVRLGACIIDLSILYIIAVCIAFFMGVYQEIVSLNAYDPALASRPDFLLVILFIPALWLYFAVQESSSAQGTIGKRVVKIRVVNGKGGRIGFGKATVRVFIKFFPVIGQLGCLAVGMSDNKQGLHDRAAQTYVMYNK